MGYFWEIPFFRNRLFLSSTSRSTIPMQLWPLFLRHLLHLKNSLLLRMGYFWVSKIVCFWNIGLFLNIAYLLNIAYFSSIAIPQICIEADCWKNHHPNIDVHLACLWQHLHQGFCSKGSTTMCSSKSVWACIHILCFLWTLYWLECFRVQDYPHTT